MIAIGIPSFVILAKLFVFNRNIHRIKKWCEISSFCKIELRFAYFWSCLTLFDILSIEFCYRLKFWICSVCECFGTQHLLQGEPESSYRFFLDNYSPGTSTLALRNCFLRRGVWNGRSVNDICWIFVALICLFLTFTTCRMAYQIQGNCRYLKYISIIEKKTVEDFLNLTDVTLQLTNLITYNVITRVNFCYLLLYYIILS